MRKMLTLVRFRDAWSMPGTWISACPEVGVPAEIGMEVMHVVGGLELSADCGGPALTAEAAAKAVLERSRFGYARVPGFDVHRQLGEALYLCEVTVGVRGLDWWFAAARREGPSWTDATREVRDLRMQQSDEFYDCALKALEGVRKEAR